ncbi:hypothetical protein B9G69_003945 [Bdellovibrio sp. SKB1291214]|uniref:hypothetical protein n=1 Tax=Bdellovibrio sp. SKB1291214 TaxID=1732569 RepID=UPI000B51C931|nr:hypothetical protein [Bdellovibrio sp. SKB1291214]UYL09725.1 hypothetical protein B9G69_003945 [Bdellovibrio sp. SKB1291214]
MKFRFLAPLAVILLSFSANAKVFRNAYISFELPDTWKCNLEQTEWVCRSEQNKESKEAIIILTAKEIGPTDTFQLYQAHLDSPISVMSKGGALTSKVVYKSKQETINDQPWVDALHMNSEVPNYFTRYVATIKNKIAILVTFSAHKQYYTKYSQDFFKAVMSMRVIAAPNLGARPELGVGGAGGMIGSNIQNAMPGDMYQDGQSGGGKSNKALLLGGALILAALGALIFLRAKKNKRK